MWLLIALVEDGPVGSVSDKQHENNFDINESPGEQVNFSNAQHE